MEKKKRLRGNVYQQEKGGCWEKETEKLHYTNKRTNLKEIEARHKKKAHAITRRQSRCVKCKNKTKEKQKQKEKAGSWEEKQRKTE